MGNNMLKAPLIKSAVLLTVILLLVYLTATSSDGSVWSSLGQIFLAVFRVAQLGVGLILALTLCFTVLAAIFLGGLTLISKESGARLFGQLCDVISAQWQFLVNLVRKNACSSGEATMARLGARLKDEIAAELAGDIAVLRTAQENAEAAIGQLQDRLAALENGTRVETFADRLDAGEKKAGELEAQVAGIGEDVQGVRKTVASLNEQVQADRQDSKVSELTGRLQQLEKEVRELAQQIGSLQETVAGRDSGIGSDDKAEPEHRLFAYIEDPEVQRQLKQLVGETLEHDMTYAGAADYLIDHTDKDTGNILNAHPSLTKEFIRFFREKS